MSWYKNEILALATTDEPALKTVARKGHTVRWYGVELEDKMIAHGLKCSCGFEAENPKHSDTMKALHEHRAANILGVVNAPEVVETVDVESLTPAEAESALIEMIETLPVALTRAERKAARRQAAAV